MPLDFNQDRNSYLVRHKDLHIELTAKMDEWEVLVIDKFEDDKTIINTRLPQDDRNDQKTLKEAVIWACKEAMIPPPEDWPEDVDWNRTSRQCTQIYTPTGSTYGTSAPWNGTIHTTATTAESITWQVLDTSTNTVYHT